MATDLKSWISFWDLFKSIFVVFLAVVIWVKADGWIDKLSRPQERGPQITEPQILKLAENLIQLQNVASKERFEALEKKLEAQNSAALKAAKEYAKKTDASITSLGSIVSSMKLSFEESKPTDTYVDPEMASRTHETYDLVRKMSDGQDLPVGWFKYHPYYEEDKKTTQVHYPLDYYTTVIKSEHENGTFTYHVEAWVQNDYLVHTKGKKYPLELHPPQFEEKPVKDKKFRFNPRLAIGGSFTSESLFPNLDISAFSYGRTVVDMDWRFLIAGLGAGKGNDDNYEFAGMFSPTQYNIGTFVPLINNLFIGPAVSVDTKSNVGYGASFSVPF